MSFFSRRRFLVDPADDQIHSGNVQAVQHAAERESLVRSLRFNRRLRAGALSDRTGQRVGAILRNRTRQRVSAIHG